MPLPWIAAELGWIVAEYGRQPWADRRRAADLLAASPVPTGQVWLSLAGFVAALHGRCSSSTLYLMRKYVAARALEPGTTAGITTPRAGHDLRCFDYATLKVIWWLLLGVLLVGFAILDGFDLGVGMLLPFVGRTDAERRV